MTAWIFDPSNIIALILGAIILIDVLLSSLWEPLYRSYALNQPERELDPADLETLVRVSVGNIAGNAIGWSFLMMLMNLYVVGGVADGKNLTLIYMGSAILLISLVSLILFSLLSYSKWNWGAISFLYFLDLIILMIGFVESLLPLIIVGMLIMISAGIASLTHTLYPEMEVRCNRVRDDRMNDRNEEEYEGLLEAEERESI